MPSWANGLNSGAGGSARLLARLGRGHAMALVHVITKGPQIDAKHVGTGTSHSDASATLWLDGKASDPARA